MSCKKSRDIQSIRRRRLRLPAPHSSPYLSLSDQAAFCGGLRVIRVPKTVRNLILKNPPHLPSLLDHRHATRGSSCVLVSLVQLTNIIDRLLVHRSLSRHDWRTFASGLVKRDEVYEASSCATRSCLERLSSTSRSRTGSLRTI